MKTKLLAALCHISLCITALAQTTALTINNSTGQINVPAGLTPYFDVLHVAGTAVPLAATPQQYGAIADGTSHPVSEWIPARYASLAAIQADFPHVTSLNDEIDWAAAQQALRLHKALYLPADVGGYVFNKELVTNDDSQIIQGGAGNGPYGMTPKKGARIIAGSGVDGIRAQNAHAAVRDLTVEGYRVGIHKAHNGTDGKAVVDTQAAHSLPTGPEISGGWTVTGNTAGGAFTIVTTSQPHGLRHGDLIKFAGSSSIPDGFYYVVVTDNTGAVISSPSPSSKYFRLVNFTDHFQVAVGSNGGAASFTKLYQIVLGPYVGYYGAEVFPLTNSLTTSGETLCGIYWARPTSTSQIELYGRQKAYGDALARLTMSADSMDDRGILYTTRHLVGFTDLSDVDFNLNSPDPGKQFSASNLFCRWGVSGVYGGTSDGGGKIEHCVASETGVGFWADGNLDNMVAESCWMDSAIYSAYLVSRNGGLVVIGGAGANSMRPFCAEDYGCQLTINGAYFEGHQSPVCNDGRANVYVECNTNNGVLIQGLRIMNQGESDHIQIHMAYGTTTVQASGSLQGMRCWQQGGKLYADPATNLIVNYYGSAAMTFDALTYQAGDYDIYSQADAFSFIQTLSGISQSGTTATAQVEDSTPFAIGSNVRVFGSSTSGNNGTFTITSKPDGTHIVYTNSNGGAANQGASGQIENLRDIPSATLQNLGKKVMINPWAGPTPRGMYQSLFLGGSRPQWYKVGFDTLEATRGGTGLTSFATGDMIYASAANTLARRAAGANGKVLTMVGGVPDWADAPGSVTTYLAAMNNNVNMDTLSGTTLTNLTELTINPTGGVPAGTYKVKIDGTFGVGPASAGFKWDLNGGTAVFANGGDYRRTLQWNRSGVTYDVNSIGGDDGGANGNLYDGETWGSAAPSKPENGRFGFQYEGVIKVTTAGSIILRVANADAVNGTTITDQGQMIRGTSITLIKQ
ncbi:MAG TPA: hypothetical protein VK961_01700 [Chthoniobacter sp.]|nr:hypothetical protein [Chthoniobacter sp.]